MERLNARVTLSEIAQFDADWRVWHLVDDLAAQPFDNRRLLGDLPITLVEIDDQMQGLIGFEGDLLALPQTSIGMMDTERVPTKRHRREREPSQAGVVNAITAGRGEEIQARKRSTPRSRSMPPPIGSGEC
jgi:hypothetical protein